VGKPETTLYPVAFEESQGPELHTFKLQAGLQVESMAISPDGRFIYWFGGLDSTGAPGANGSSMGVYRALIQ
jgi:hypothetical protein